VTFSYHEALFIYILEFFELDIIRSCDLDVKGIQAIQVLRSISRETVAIDRLREFSFNLVVTFKKVFMLIDTNRWRGI
jgi:hypothetical protein